MFCLSVGNVLFDQDDYDVAGVWCVVCGHCCDQEGVASALTSIPTYTCTYAQSYVYLHNTPNPTYTYLQYPFLPTPRPTYYTQFYQHLHYPSSSWDQGGIFRRLRMCNYDWLKTSGIICRTGLLNICSYVTAGNCITWVSLVQNCSNLTANLLSCS